MPSGLRSRRVKMTIEKSSAFQTRYLNSLICDHLAQSNNIVLKPVYDVEKTAIFTRWEFQNVRHVTPLFSPYPCGTGNGETNGSMETIRQRS